MGQTKPSSAVFYNEAAARAFFAVYAGFSEFY